MNETGEYLKMENNRNSTLQIEDGKKGKPQNWRPN